jgi:hypothetical protein
MRVVVVAMVAVMAAAAAVGSGTFFFFLSLLLPYSYTYAPYAEEIYSETSTQHKFHSPLCCVLAQPHRDGDVREVWVHRWKNTNTMAFSRASKLIVWELKTNIKTFI